MRGDVWGMKRKCECNTLLGTWKYCPVHGKEAEATSVQDGNAYMTPPGKQESALASVAVAPSEKWTKEKVFELAGAQCPHPNGWKRISDAHNAEVASLTSRAEAAEAERHEIADILGTLDLTKPATFKEWELRRARFLAKVGGARNCFPASSRLASAEAALAEANQQILELKEPTSEPNQSPTE